MNDGNIILSSRVRLARNIEGMPFRGAALGPIQSKVMNALHDKGSYMLYSMQGLNPIEQTSYVERHLISKELIDYGGAAIIRNDNKISIMLG